MNFVLILVTIMDLEAVPWTITSGWMNDIPIIFRFREFPDGFPKSNFPHRLNIFWQIPESSDSGMPDDVETDRMNTFENRLVEATEFDEQAVLSMVVTERNEREYVIHTRDAQEFLRRLTDMPQETERYPIEIHHTDDSKWEYCDRLLAQFNLKWRRPDTRDCREED